MIQSLEPVGPGPRLDPLFLQGRGPVIDAEQARLLGLRNGQVVQAVIDQSASAFSVLWPAGQRQGLPTALQAFPLPSQWRWAAGSNQELMAFLMPGGHIMLKPLRPGASPAAGTAAAGSTAASGTPSSAAGAAGATGATRAALAAATGAPSAGVSPKALSTTPGVSWVPPQPPAAYSMGQAFAAAQGAAGSGSSAELARLMQQAPAWAGLIRLLQNLATTGDEDSAAADDPTAPAPSPLGPRLADLLSAGLPRMANLTPAVLQRAMMHSGLGTEAALLAGSLGLDQDLKVALRRLSRQQAPTLGGGVEPSLGRAIDTLERSQLDSLSAQLQGQVLLAMVIPFGDAGPVALRIMRERSRPDEEPPPFVVDVHSAHSPLGPLWLRTQVARDQRVSLTMWALRDEVAEHARTQAHALRRSLQDSGLALGSLDIMNGAPRRDDQVFMGEALSA